jgi:hypothetical protein
MKFKLTNTTDALMIFDRPDLDLVFTLEGKKSIEVEQHHFVPLQDFLVDFGLTLEPIQEVDAKKAEADKKAVDKAAADAEAQRVASEKAAADKLAADKKAAEEAAKNKK